MMSRGANEKPAATSEWAEHDESESIHLPVRRDPAATRTLSRVAIVILAVIGSGGLATAAEVRAVYPEGSRGRRGLILPDC